MIRESYTIAGGNYRNAGLASSLLKTRLKKIGVDPAVLRRVMIAAYEAEMNVVIHADRGTLDVTFGDSYLDMEIRDEGPGIQNITQAMKEGYSTAPETAREMGFGAGMGLPNIRKNSDFFRIESSVGKGTYIRATIRLNSVKGTAGHGNSLIVREGVCSGCLACVRACPMGSIRVHEKRPEILRHRCVDCTTCMGVCESGAIILESRSFFPVKAERGVLLVPTELLAQFGAAYPPRYVFRVLEKSGFSDVFTTAGCEAALREAVAERSVDKKVKKPVISPVCPAVVNLIETRFPSLIPLLAPFLSPLEALLSTISARPLLCVAACPSQFTLFRSMDDECEAIVVSPSEIYTIVRAQELRPVEIERLRAESDPLEENDSFLESSQKSLLVGGMNEVVDILERTENGLVEDVEILEPYACRYGCAGSPLYRENPALAGHRTDRISMGNAEPKVAVKRKEPYRSREGMRLHPNLAEAIVLLSKIDTVMGSLPGKDCGMCGAPDCAALAEDIVLGRATVSDCVQTNRKGDEGQCN